MRQDQITTFFLKYKNTFSAEESIQIQRLLENTKEEAFTVLMNYKPAFSWKILLYCIATILIGLGLFLAGWAFLEDSDACLPAIISLTFGGLFYYYARRAKSKKEFTLEEVLKILNAFQAE